MPRSLFITGYRRRKGELPLGQSRGLEKQPETGPHDPKRKSTRMLGAGAVQRETGTIETKGAIRSLSPREG